MPFESSMSAVALTASIFIAVFISFPIFFRGRQKSINRDDLYNDEDGTTTRLAQAKFMRRHHVYVISMLIITTFGLLVNISAAIMMRNDLNNVSLRLQLLDIFLEICAIILLAFQAVAICLTSSSIDRYRQGLLVALCSLLVYGANLWHDYQWFLISISALGFLVLHLILLLLSCFANITIHRRPQLFDNSQSPRPVDEQSTVSVLSRYTLSWASPILSYAVRKGGLDFGDLPRLEVRTTVRSLVANFHSVKSGRLWMQIALVHRWVFLQQWALTLFHAFATLAPPYFMWQLIRVLEKSSENPSSIAVVWLTLLGLAQLIQPWIETWMLWVGWCHIALPIHVQLSGLIVEKSMRKKDVKDRRTIDHSVKYNKSAETHSSMDMKYSNNTASADETTEALKTKQDQINLVNVDAQRISDFLSYNGMFMGILLILCISLFFLLSIISFKSILLALVGISFVVPLNIFANRRYSSAQNRLMKVRDLKTAALTEALQGIRQIKFDALEQQFHKKLNAIRDSELSQQWKAYLAENLLMLCWIAAPTMFAAIALSIVSTRGDGLSPSVAFTALSIFQRLEATLSLIPVFITDFFDARVSMGRIEEFLASPEHVDSSIDSDTMTFQDASVSWPMDVDNPGRFALQNLNLEFPRHELSVIAGPTGAGKSLMLAALVGEADILHGKLRRPRKDLVHFSENTDHSGSNWIVPRAIALVVQTPWIENATLRDNVLFGLPFYESRYWQVLYACALLQDIKTMEEGHWTEIGSHGVGLSGGQRCRLALARALYSPAETLVFDDIFSAVDAHTRRHLFEHALTGPLTKGRTCILATHHVELCLSKTVYTVVLNNGYVEYAGPPEKLTLKEASRTLADVDHPDQKAIIDTATVKSSDSTSSEATSNLSRISVADSSDELVTNTEILEHIIKADDQPKKLVEDERYQRGKIKFSVYTQYLRAASNWPWSYWTSVLCIIVGFEVAFVGRNWWIRAWSETTEASSRTGLQILPHGLLSMHYPYMLERNTTTANLPSGGPRQDNKYYIIVYFCISVLICFLSTFKFFWVYTGSIRASHVLFDKMTAAMLHAPLRWLDTVPTGRILNRFTADFNVLDSTLANHLVLLLYYALQLVGIITAGIIVSPYLLLFAVPLLAICISYARQYLAGARDVKRLESIMKSPVLEELDSILSGLPTIRAWSKSVDYIDSMYTKIDNHARCVWHLWLFNRWLSMRFAVIGAIFTTAVAVFAVYSPRVSASLAGLALSFSLEFTQSVFWVLRRYADIEMDMNSLERITEFCAVPAETTEGDSPPAHWPSSGRIDISNLCVGYAPDLPAVLHGISFGCLPNSAVGIVGRTGAGKSSLTLALFRFLEARSGCIEIDGRDISQIALKDLRARLAIIPQHPVLWQGTIRSNLDPFGEHDDVLLRDVLERVHLNHQEQNPSQDATTITNTIGGPFSDTTLLPVPEQEQQRHANASSTPPLTTAISLDFDVSEGGHNLSVGQRQLLCLARAVLSRPKILIMDEATSAVDAETDVLVQQSLRRELVECTLLVIAHKLSTVVDLDVIVVMEQGTVKEMGTPKELWERGGAFKGMVEESGDGEELVRRMR